MRPDCEPPRIIALPTMVYCAEQWIHAR